MNVHNCKNNIAIYCTYNFYKCEDVHSKIRDMIRETREVYSSELQVDSDEILDYMSSLLLVIERKYTKQTGCIPK